MDRDAVAPKTWIAIFGASLGAFMAVLNIQIVNASLADIQGSIGAGIDDGGWISTSYLVAEIVVIPLTGWLSQVFSVRRYLLANAALFLVFSVACASAHHAESDDRAACIPGIHRRRADTDGIHLDHHVAAESEAADRSCAVCGFGDVRAGHRPDDRRLPHGKLELGIRLLRQPGAGCGRCSRCCGSRSSARRCGSRCCAAATGAALRRSRSDWPRCRRHSRKATRTTGSARRSSCGC